MPVEQQNLPLEDKHARGVEAYRQSRLPEASTLLAQSLSDAETCECWNDWAAVQTAIRNIANAEVAFRRALQLDAGNREARTNLGALLAQTGRSAEALDLLESIGNYKDATEAGVITRLIGRCREQVALQNSLAAGGEQRSSELLARALERQTASLSIALLRLVALESRLHVIPSSLGSASVEARPKIPRVSPHAILNGATPLDLLALNSTEENVSLHELCLLAALVRQSEGVNLFEIGTADGRTTLNLAANAADGGSVWTLNIPRPGLGQRFLQSPLRGKITQLIGDSAAFDFSPYAGRVDFVFIDANHEYEYVLSDSRTALGLLREGHGTIVWHDYAPHWPGVVRALEHLYATDSTWSGLRHIESTSLVFAHVGAPEPLPGKAA